MARKVYDVDNNALYAIKGQIDRKEVKNWTEGRSVYSALIGKDIPSAVLRRRANDLIAEDLNLMEVSRYSNSLKQKEIEESKVNFDPNKELVIDNNVFDLTLDNGSKTVQQSIGITEDDKTSLFGILPEDDGITQKKKIMTKISDEKFLLEYLNLDPNLYAVEKLEPGAWTVAMKLNQQGQDVPVIVTNDRIGIKISRKKHIERDFLEVSKQVTEFLKEEVPNIKYPDMKVARRTIRNKKDILVTQHISDLHFGGLTHYLETSFDNWDSKKAANVQHEIIRYTIDRQVNQWNSKTLYMCINGDLFDIDNLLNKTSSMSQHTMQTDSRWNKLYSDQLAIMMYSLIQLSPYFDDIFVDFNRGNHDKQSMDALYLNIATSILMSSKLKNIHIDYDKSALFKESYFSWGKHLFLSTHGELADKTLVQNLEVKYSDLIRRHPYVNITAGHTHQMSMNFFGDKIVFREPSLCPVTAFEAETMGLNGKATTAQIFKIWEKDKRMPLIEPFEFERKKLWKDNEDPTPDTAVSSMEELQEFMFEEGLMRPTHKQIELAKYYNGLYRRVKSFLNEQGQDTSNITPRKAMEIAKMMGLKLPIELRHENENFVLDNMRRILRP